MRLSDPGAIEAIARLLGATLKEAPFAVPPLPAGLEGQPPTDRQEPVYQLMLPAEEPGQKLLIWPSLARVDVRLGNSYWVLRNISSVEMYPGIEVLFRREEPSAFLFVSVRGRVALVC